MSRKVILYIAMSLDGYIAKKDGDVSWLKGDGSEPNNQLEESYQSFYSTIDTVIMGRKTYEQVLSFGDYPYKETKGYVYTSKKTGSDKHVTFTNEPVEKFLNDLKKQEGKDIWLIGGADIIDPFIKKDLIDEYHIAIIPCILGEGIPLFKDQNPEILLKLQDCTCIDGTAIFRYMKR